MHERSHLTRSLLDPAAMFAGARHPASGAIVLFSGDTRNHSRNREVLYLEYEAHEELAEKMIGEILNEAKRRWSLNSALCVHRLGRVDISESAVVVITSSAHRDAAYESNRFIIDRVKLTVPIWKNEFFADGSAIWSDPQR